MNNLTFKFWKIAFIAILIPLATMSLAAQISVSMVEKLVEKSNQKCFDVFVANKSENKLGLAGQNLRFFYNSDQMVFDDKSLVSLMPQQYTDIKLVQNYIDINAIGYGSLPFEKNMGFVNLAFDFKEYADSPLSLEKGGKVSVCSFCFNSDNFAELPEVVWAKESLTSNYATAFVQVAIVQDKIFRAAQIEDYSINLLKGKQDNIIEIKDFSYFPNPFSNFLYIKFNSPTTDQVKVKVSNIFGESVYSTVVDKNTEEFQLNGSELKPGGYLIEIIEANGTKSNIRAIKIK